MSGRAGGYSGRSLEVLRASGVSVGDSVTIRSDTATHRGIVMPRYEHGDDAHIVLKLDSGYNVGLKVSDIQKINKNPAAANGAESAGGGEGEGEQQQQQAKKTEGLPGILLLSTGGTIASRVDYRTGAVTPILTAEQINSSVPEVSQIANIDTEVLFSEYSENMMPEHWLAIAKRISACAGSGYAGIIVAHGTDTMHYTSSFLSFAVAGFPVPVVLVGSQRSSDRASSDAALNLIGAARFITECGEPGVYVAMHQDGNDGSIACHAGTRVRKSHTSKRGAFHTIGDKPAFVVTETGITRNAGGGGYYGVDGFKPRIHLDQRVALVKYHPGYDPRHLDWIVENGYRGIIFEGTGLGHVGRAMYEAVGRAAEKGLFLGMTSQCIDGRVRMTVYESGRDLLDLGITPLEDMIPEVALVKAMWAMGAARDGNDIRSAMLEKVASEMTP